MYKKIMLGNIEYIVEKNTIGSELIEKPILVV